MKTKDTLENIVPLVLLTQLDSEDSDSEDEKTVDGDEEINEDAETNQYDEDIDGQVGVPSLKKEEIYKMDDKTNLEENREVRHVKEGGTETLHDNTFICLFISSICSLTLGSCSGNK
jgi:hypothetical protein